MDTLKEHVRRLCLSATVEEVNENYMAAIGRLVELGGLGLFRDERESLAVESMVNRIANNNLIRVARETFAKHEESGGRLSGAVAELVLCLSSFKGRDCEADERIALLYYDRMTGRRP